MTSICSSMKVEDNNNNNNNNRADMGGWPLRHEVADRGT